jgi:hypothetical protein
MQEVFFEFTREKQRAANLPYLSFYARTKWLERLPPTGIDVAFLS